MDPNTLFLACGSMRFTPEQDAFFRTLLLSTLSLWMVSAIMAFISLCFLWNPKLSNPFKIINGSIPAICVLVVLSLFQRMWIEDVRTAAIVAFGIPLVLISQFVFLMITRWRLRRSLE